MSIFVEILVATFLSLMVPSQNEVQGEKEDLVEQTASTKNCASYSDEILQKKGA